MADPPPSTQKSHRTALLPPRPPARSECILGVINNAPHSTCPLCRRPLLAAELKAGVTPGEAAAAAAAAKAAERAGEEDEVRSFVPPLSPELLGAFTPALLPGRCN